MHMFTGHVSSLSVMMLSQITSARKQIVKRAVDHCWMIRAHLKMTSHHHVNNHLITTLGESWEGRCCFVCVFFKGLYYRGRFLVDNKITSLHRVRLRSDGAAVPRHRSGTDTHSPTRGTDTPPRAAACPSSPHKVSISKGRIESPEKRRLGTFGSAGSINYLDRKAYPEGHPLRPLPGATRHSSLGDHKSLEAEALAEVRVCHHPMAFSIFSLMAFRNRTSAALCSALLHTIKMHRKLSVIQLSDLPHVIEL